MPADIAARIGPRPLAGLIGLGLFLTALALAGPARAYEYSYDDVRQLCLDAAREAIIRGDEVEIREGPLIIHASPVRLDESADEAGNPCHLISFVVWSHEKIFYWGVERLCGQ